MTNCLGGELSEYMNRGPVVGDELSGVQLSGDELT